MDRVCYSLHDYLTPRISQRFNLTIKASLAPRNAIFFYTIFTQGQIHKSTNISGPLQELEESAQQGSFSSSVAKKYIVLHLR